MAIASILDLLKNERHIVVSLFDYSGIMVKPWVDNGYQAWIVDWQHPIGVNQVAPNMYKVGANLMRPWMPPFSKHLIAFVSAFPPCDHTAVSGARWFKGKGLRALSDSTAMFATAAEFCEWSEAKYMIENPVSTMATYWRKPDYTFDPCDYTALCADDNYTKKTCLWTGNGFTMPAPEIDNTLGAPDDRIHTAPPGADRKNFRSRTPAGFAEAVFHANKLQNVNLKSH